MEKLIEKVNNLKEQLNKEEVVKEIKELNKEIKKDKQLLELIKKYQQTHDENIKEEIIKNNLFRKYKEKETDLNIIILSINQRLKEIAKKDKCSL